MWNGYAIPGTENDEEYVYVTEDSEVYHRSRECTHLRLSVRRVEAAEIPKGYHPCEKCMVQKKDAAAPEENRRVNVITEGGTAPGLREPYIALPGKMWTGTENAVDAEEYKTGEW